MGVPESKALTRDRGLRNYSRMRKAELVALLRNNPPPSRSWGPPGSTGPPQRPLTQTWEPIDDGSLRVPTQQEMDVSERQEMSKSRPQVRTKLNKWYD